MRDSGYGIRRAGDSRFKIQEKNHLDSVFPVAGPPMAVSNGQDLDRGG